MELQQNPVKVFHFQDPQFYPSSCCLYIRGVHEFEVLVDDFLIYRGILNKAPPLRSNTDSTVTPYTAGRIGKRGRRRGENGEAAPKPLDFAQTILFTDDPTLYAQEQAHIFIPEPEEHCLFINENTVVASPSQDIVDTSVRPTTSTGSHRFDGK